MPRIIDTTDPNYIARRNSITIGKYNGAYYYSKDIVDYIIPRVHTDRPWDTLGIRACRSMDHAIIFVHHCRNWDRVYNWLHSYKDQILVCSTWPTLDWAKRRGKKAIFLPLSIDITSVQKFKTEKTKEACYAGNRWSFKREDENRNIPAGVDFPPAEIPREEMLKFIAPYKELYAIGRCALEGLALGCEIKPFYSAYPDPNYWVLRDCSETAQMLQESLDLLDSSRIPTNQRRRYRL